MHLAGIDLEIDSAQDVLVLDTDLQVSDLQHGLHRFTILA